MRFSPSSQDSATLAGVAPLTGNPARDLANSINIRFIFFLLLHVPLAMLMELSPWFSTAHAALALLYGLRASLLGRTSQVIYAIAYIASCEVLWRMSRAHLVWEYAKYGIVLLMFVALIVDWRQRGDNRRIRSALPLLLLVALLPGAVMTILETGIGEARDPLSFNLAGYLAIVLMALYLWGRPVNQVTTYRALLAIMAPIVGITFLASYYTVRSLGALNFVSASNWITSGSYGPNQVSNMMGFGALVGTMLFILMPRAQMARIVIILMAVAMVVQGLLTFSRGGIYSFILALAVFAFHLMTNPRARGRLVLLFVFFGVLLVVGIYPMLDQFTGGVLAERFRDLDTTGRLQLAEIELQVFVEHPIAGLGVGRVSDYMEAYYGLSWSAHTEFTRLLAEHGLFGILALLILLWMLLNRYLANPPGLSRGITAAMAVWSMTIMIHSAMRLAAIPLAIGLAMVLWQLPQSIKRTADSAGSVVPETGQIPSG